MPDRPKPAYLSERWTGPSTPRLLLVDDDEMMRRSSERFLRRAGFEVVTAADGHKALALIEGGLEIDAAVIDLEMPGMSGIDLMRQLAEQRPGTPLGLWSASDELRDLDREDLAIAWFVKSKMDPIGHLVQAVCKAIYGAREASGHVGGATSGDGGASGDDPPGGLDARGWAPSDAPTRDTHERMRSYADALRPAPVPEPVRTTA